MYVKIKLYFILRCKLYSHTLYTTQVLAVKNFTQNISNSTHFSTLYRQKLQYCYQCEHPWKKKTIKSAK